MYEQTPLLYVLVHHISAWFGVQSRNKLTVVHMSEPSIVLTRILNNTTSRNLLMCGIYQTLFANYPIPKVEMGIRVSGPD